MKNAILYSFRRWPYAIRARLALSYVNFEFEHREVNLKNRPKDLYIISPKGTVPVLQLNNNRILDESLDIVLWSNDQNKSQNLLRFNSKFQLEIIKKNDIDFKFWLDKYKYFDRFPEYSKEYYFKKASLLLKPLDDLLTNNHYIMNENIQLVDLAIFPFIRQFANVDLELFSEKFTYLYRWYIKISESYLFKNVMQKYDFWDKKDKPLIINLNG